MEWKWAVHRLCATGMRRKIEHWWEKIVGRSRRLYYKCHSHWERDLPVSLSFISRVHSDATSVPGPALRTQCERLTRWHRLSLEKASIWTGRLDQEPKHVPCSFLPALERSWARKPKWTPWTPCKGLWLPLSDLLSGVLPWSFLIPIMTAWFGLPHKTRMKFPQF